MIDLISSNDKKLSSLSIATLTRNPHLVPYIQQENLKFPFPAAYTPSVIEVFFEDKLAITFSVERQVASSERFPEHYDPEWVEWKFDGECAFLQCHKDVLIDRISKMVDFDFTIFAQLN